MRLLIHSLGLRLLSALCTALKQKETSTLSAEQALDIVKKVDPELEEQCELHVFFSKYRCVWKGDRKVWIYSRWGEDGYPTSHPIDVIHFPGETFDIESITLDSIRNIFYPWFAEQERGK